MWDGLLIGLIPVIATGFGLLMLGLPNRLGESPRFLQGSLSPMLYPPVILGISCRGNCRIDRLGCDDEMAGSPRRSSPENDTRSVILFQRPARGVSNIWQFTATAGGRA